MVISIGVDHHNITLLLSKYFHSHHQILVNHLVKKVGQRRGQHNTVVDPLKSDALEFKS